MSICVRNTAINKLTPVKIRHHFSELERAQSIDYEFCTNFDLRFSSKKALM